MESSPVRRGFWHLKDFFELPARRVFLSTDYIRPRSELDYTLPLDLTISTATA